MDLIIASNNQHKIKEIKAILNTKFENIFSLKDAEINVEVEEDGKTFEQNALKKATEISKLKPDCAILADDSGLCVRALFGEPGIFSARYSQSGTDESNRKKLLEKMETVEDRFAYFVCCVAVVFPKQSKKPPIVCFGKVEGTICEKQQGTNGFGYDPIFYVEQKNKTFAQLTDNEKNEISHRKKAIEKLLLQI